MLKKPLLSIITINYNDLEGLKGTLLGVSHQTWKEFEYIVIDGGSTDGSKEFIESQNDKIDIWVSEEDSGIYNAMNKGINAASGEYLLFLNSGDFLNNNNVLSQVAEKLIDGFDIFYGDVQLRDNKKSEKKDVLVYPEKLKFSFFCNSTIIHQAAFIKKTLFDEVFYYNEELKFVSDWEFFICAICKYNATYKKLNFVLIDFDINGISSDPVNEKLLYQERDFCLKEHFPLIMADYKELIDSRNKLNLPIVKSTLELQDYIAARKLHRMVLNFLLKMSKIKNNNF
ncbi:glycosyltransferase family 2 protein [Gillisia sp. JM1]|uniref:glycosyltransferase family 2 protein n=1 Tax=Gillisia sp. JM1 TaxID=1283286 RepID=UPI0004060395|nr:glycosyltransferase family 2 protein [Gillisia sp. JM1]